MTKFVRAARERRKWSQGDLAAAAGGISRTTVATLEQGTKLREGKEAAIEAALGWEIGSLDAIRKGGQPILAGQSGAGGLYEMVRRDSHEEAMWSVTGASEAKRWEAIFKYRENLAAARQQQDARRSG